jgi:hypothetical protein
MKKLGIAYFILNNSKNRYSPPKNKHAHTMRAWDAEYKAGVIKDLEKIGVNKVGGNEWQ